MLKKLSILILAGVMFICAMTGCGKKNEAPAEPDKKQEKSQKDDKEKVETQEESKQEIPETQEDSADVLEAEEPVESLNAEERSKVESTTEPSRETVVTEQPQQIPEEPAAVPEEPAVTEQPEEPQIHVETDSSGVPNIEIEFDDWEKMQSEQSTEGGTQVVPGDEMIEFEIDFDAGN